MPRSEAQRAADKKYRDMHKNDTVRWCTWLKPEEAAAIDAVIKGKGLNKAQFLRWAADKLSKEE